MKLILLISLFMAVGIVATVNADMFTPSHSCSKPYKPYEFNDEYEVENFNNEVEEYKQCISSFVEEQNDAAKNHQDAAQEAIDDWNNFVDYELN